MKKLLLTILIVLFLATPVYALTVTMIGHTFHGSYVATQAQIAPMSRLQVQAALGPPDKSYGFCDVWIKHDQIYVGYYDIMGQPTSVVLLPVTYW